MARGSQGELILRIEDTDRERSTPENVEQIIDALRWLELDWDGEPVSQFDRREHHIAATERLLSSGAAYRDAATAADVKAWKQANGNRGYRGVASTDGAGAVRLRVPDDGETIVTDLIRGEVAFPNHAQDDFPVARADGTPLYNLAVAVDDAQLGITDVVRGDDHLSNTPKQALVLAALGESLPRYAHLPLLHGPDGKKLSKRHGAASVQELRDDGYLPAAIRNYLALLGWGTTDDETILSTAELLERFELGRVGRSPAIFDERKLRWLNGRFMRELPMAEYTDAVAGHLERGGVEVPSRDALAAGCAIARDKAQTLAEVWPLIAFLFTEPVDDPGAREKFLGAGSRGPLAAARAAIAACEPFDAPALERELGAVVAAEAVKPKALYQPIRVAITGTTVSPGIFDSLAALGRERALERIDAALA